VYLGAHNPLDVVGGAAIGLAIAAVLDLALDVARDRGGRREQPTPTGEDQAALRLGSWLGCGRLPAWSVDACGLPCVGDGWAFGRNGFWSD
jgi:membrane-associated phospholipid phosphatase